LKTEGLMLEEDVARVLDVAVTDQRAQALPQ
jgi:hypothetical protein